MLSKKPAIRFGTLLNKVGDGNNKRWIQQDQQRLSVLTTYNYSRNACLLFLRKVVDVSTGFVNLVTTSFDNNFSRISTPFYKVSTDVYHVLACVQSHA